MRARLKKFLTTPHVIMIAGANLAAMLNFLVNILLTRNLLPEDSAKYFAIAAIPPLVYSVFSFVPYRVASLTMSELHAGELDSQNLSKDFYKHLLATGIWTLMLVLLAVPLNHAFVLGDEKLLALLFVVLFFTAQVNFMSGLFQGLENYFFVALKDISISFVKAGALIFLLYWLNLRNAWAPLLAEATAIAFTLLWFFGSGKKYINPISKLPGTVFSAKGMANYFLSSAPIIGGVTLIGLVTSFDVLVAKNFLQTKDAGYLIAASNLAKIVFFTCGSVPTVVYLFATKYRIKGDAKENIKSLKFSFSMVVVIGLMVASLIGLSQEFLVTKMYGDTYLPTLGLLAYMLGYMFFISLSIMLINFLMGQKWTRPLWILAFSYISFFIYNLTLSNVAPAQLALNLLIFSVLILLILMLSTAVCLRCKAT